MQSFSEAQRVSYLRFVWGRSRLPLTPDGFARRHKLSLLHRSPADAYLPVAHTCFFSIDLPAYSNRNTMRDKLLYAITHCQAIDADDTTAARQAAGGSTWREDVDLIEY